jgi:hypothetical protein
MRPLVAIAALAVVLAAAACGGSGESSSAIPSSVAGRLAAQSESIAAAWEAGDRCGAAQQADDLRHAADEAIAAGEIPVAYQRALEAAVTNLQNTANCPPPEEDSQGDEGNGHGKAKGHDKHGTPTIGTSTGTTTGEGD